MGINGINAPWWEELQDLILYIVTPFFLDFDWPMENNGHLISMMMGVSWLITMINLHNDRSYMVNCHD